MNITVINAVAELLKNIPPKLNTGFNMGSYSQEVADSDYSTNVEHKCGTTACIAGWVAEFFKTDGTLLKRRRTDEQIQRMGYGGVTPYSEVAAGILGIDDRTAYELFEPMNARPSLAAADWDAVTPQQAAKVLRHLATTGEVDWKVAFDD